MLAPARLRAPAGAREARVAGTGETLAQLVALAGCALLLRVDGFPVAALVVPLLVWAALRLDPRVLAAELLGVVGVTTATTTDGWHPRADVVGDLLSLSVGCLALALMAWHRRSLVRQAHRETTGSRREFSESPVGRLTLLLDAHGAVRVVEANRAASLLVPALGPDPTGLRLADLLSPIDAADSAAGLDHVITGTLADGPITWDGEVSVPGRPQSVMRLSVTALDGAERGAHLAATLLDLSEERSARGRLEQAHHLTDATLDTAGCMILVVDADGRIVRANEATHTITGYRAGDLAGRRVWESPVAPLDEAETLALFLWPNRSGAPLVRERRHLRADGTAVSLVWSCNVVAGDAHGPDYAVMTGIDVTAERASSGLIVHLMRASVFTALIAIDDAGTITMANVGADQLTGSATGDLVGRSFIDLLDPAQLDERVGTPALTGPHEPASRFAALVASMGGRESGLQDWTWRTVGGRARIVSMTMSVDDSTDGPAAYLCVARDVTEQRTSQQAVLSALETERTAVERLRHLDHAKDEFVSTVSHELRTPVTSILGYAELVHDELEDSSYGARHLLPMLDTITRNAQRLTAICNDLLLLSGFEHLGEHLSAARHDLRSVVRMADESARSLALARDLRIACRLPEQPVWVDGDQSQLDRMLVNLVSNAVKFTPDGGSIEITLDSDAPAPGGAGEAVITVTDTGIGIDSADHEQVFQRFYRTEPAQTRAIQGTGLGLAIVAGIVEAHRGRIELESSTGHGARFTIRLPLAPTATATAAASPSNWVSRRG